MLKTETENPRARPIHITKYFVREYERYKYTRNDYFNIN